MQSSQYFYNIKRIELYKKFVITLLKDNIINCQFSNNKIHKKQHKITIEKTFTIAYTTNMRKIYY